jgi:hypothetical protein
MELTEFAAQLSKIYKRQKLEWTGYGLPTPDDLTIALAAMADAASEGDIPEEGYEEPTEVAIELPNAGLRLTRFDGVYNVWLNLGEVDIDAYAHD